MTNPFSIIKHRYSTEKTMVLEGLKGSQSNRCITKYSLPKHVFIVDKNANKGEIRDAIEEIYAEKKVRVLKVNTITMKPKKRRVRGKIGFKSGYKKAIVTLREGDSIEERA